MTFDPLQEYPAECCPDRCYMQFPCLAGDHDSPFWQGWGALRIKTFRLIENKYFETAVITMILVSSLALVSGLKNGRLEVSIVACLSSFTFHFGFGWWGR